MGAARLRRARRGREALTRRPERAGIVVRPWSGAEGSLPGGDYRRLTPLGLVLRPRGATRFRPVAPLCLLHATRLR